MLFQRMYVETTIIHNKLTKTKEWKTYSLCLKDNTIQ